METVMSIGNHSEALLPPYAPMPVGGDKHQGLPRTRIYELAGLGKIRLVKVGRRALIDTRSVTQYLDALPAAEIARPRLQMQAA
jgi:hypothetical protein